MMEVHISGNLDDVVCELKKYRDAGLDVYCMFNGYKLYSKDIDMDSAYLQVTGVTYAEHLRKKLSALFELEVERAEAKKKIPEWNARGHKLIAPEKWSHWDAFVSARVKGMYAGAEIEVSLKIMEAHNSGKSIEEIYNIIESQEFSKNSLIRLIDILKEFYIHGYNLTNELITYIRNNINKLSQ